MMRNEASEKMGLRLALGSVKASVKYKGDRWHVTVRDDTPLFHAASLVNMHGWETYVPRNATRTFYARWIVEEGSDA